MAKTAEVVKRNRPVLTLTVDVNGTEVILHYASTKAAKDAREQFKSAGHPAKLELVKTID